MTASIKARAIATFEAGHVGHYDTVFRCVGDFDDQEDPDRFIPVVAERRALPGQVVTWLIRGRGKATKIKPSGEGE